MVPLVLLCFLWPMPLPARTPNEAAVQAAQAYSRHSALEIRQAAEAAALEQTQEIPVAVQAINAATAQFAAESSTDARAIDGEQQRERVVVLRMQEAIREARNRSLKEVVETAEAWLRKQADVQILQLEEPELQRTLDEEHRAEEVRRQATGSVEVAAAAAQEMLELARQARRVANSLQEAHAQDNATAAAQRNRMAAALATQSLRLARLAGTRVLEASELASASLETAKTAERTAAQALDTARRNSARLAALKARALAAFREASGVGFAQRRAVLAAAAAA